jgi:hypothetical protein
LHYRMSGKKSNPELFVNLFLKSFATFDSLYYGCRKEVAS